jgi:tetratricopeptide (TPR) repeat protein
LAEANGRKDVLAGGISNLGIAYKNVGDYDKAEKTYLKGIRLNQELDNKGGLSLNYSNLGIFVHAKGRP